MLRHLCDLATLLLLAVFVIALAISCASPCDEPAADLDADDDTDACRLRCGDYRSCPERLPVCCRGVCQAEACK